MANEGINFSKIGSSSVSSFGRPDGKLIWADTSDGSPGLKDGWAKAWLSIVFRLGNNPENSPEPSPQSGDGVGV